MVCNVTMISQGYSKTQEANVVMHMGGVDVVPSLSHGSMNMSCGIRCDLKINRVNIFQKPVITKDKLKSIIIKLIIYLVMNDALISRNVLQKET